MSREAMQLALEALEDANDVARMEFSDENYYSEAINALRQALEEKQEPVAWMFVNEDGECEQIEYGPVFDDPGVTPLYAAPPKKEWVGLTDDDVSYFRYQATFCDEFDAAFMAELIEKDLKEKNHG
jgi:hypothetical protein